MQPAIIQRITSRSTARALLVAGVAACTVTVAGCGGSAPDQKDTSAAEAPAATPAVDGCTAVSAPLSTIEGRNPGEPRMLIPQPGGWERVTTLDSDLIRYVMANRSLTAESFTPNVVVTLEHVPGTDVSPQDVLDQQRNTLQSRGGTTDMEVRPTTTCGVTAELVDYTLPAQGVTAAHPAKVLVTAAPFEGDTWSATVTVQAVNADDPTYQQDATTILTGFQLLAPDGT